MDIDSGTPEGSHRRKLLCHPGLLFLAVLLGGFLLRIIRLVLNSPLWGDEAMLVRSLLDRNYAETLLPLDYNQLAPVGYLWTELTLFHCFGPSEWVWRLVSLVSGCAALWMFFCFVKANLPKHAAWLAVAIFASSTYLVRHSVEAKPYMSDLLVSLCLSQLGWRIHQAPDRISRWLVFGVFSVVGVWCSFPSVFVAGGILVSLIVSLDVKSLFKFLRKPSSTTETSVKGPASRLWMIRGCWFGCGLSLSVSFIVMYLITGSTQFKDAQRAGYWQMSMWEVAFPPSFRPDQFLLWLVREHAGTMMAHPFGGRNFGSSGTLILVVFGVIALWKHNARLTGMLLGPALLGLVAACLHKYPYGGTARTMLYLAPAICLFAGMGAWVLIVHFCSSKSRRIAVSCCLVGALVLMGGRLISEIVFPYKDVGDWIVREQVHKWAAESRPEDVWIMANATVLPDRTDNSLYGIGAVAVVDHYALLFKITHVMHPRSLPDFPKSANQVTVFVHESTKGPLPMDIGTEYLRHFESSASLNVDETIQLNRMETLRRMVFVSPASAN